MRSPAARTSAFIGVLIAVMALSTSVRGQIASAPARFLASPTQVVAIRAGRLFDARSGTMLANQIVLISGDRIADVGPACDPGGRARDRPQRRDRAARHDRRARPRLPAGRTRRRGHARRSSRGERAGRSRRRLHDGRSTWTRAAGSAPSISATRSTAAWCWGRACRSSASRSTSARATAYPTRLRRFHDGFTENKNVNSPWLARAAVREAKLHGVDWVKIYTTQDFVGDEYTCSSRTARWSTARR